jgi:hypothetical protein
MRSPSCRPLLFESISNRSRTKRYRVCIPPMTTGSGTTAAAAGTAASTRFLLTFAYIPDEACWCVCSTFAAIARKALDAWDVEDCALVYYLTSNAGKATAVKMTTEEDFEAWYRNGSPLTPKLIVHDRSRSLKVTHSSGFCPMSHRPILDALVLKDIGASYYVRHSGVDEVFLVTENEPAVWGRAVQKAQRAWNVHRPLFRYVDDVHGERVVVSILDANDFSMWATHRRPLLPELTVFEHAAPQLLDGPVSYALPPAKLTKSAGTSKSPTQTALTTGKLSDAEQREISDRIQSTYRAPPTLKNPESVATLLPGVKGAAAGKDDSQEEVSTVGEDTFRHLQRLLQRRAEVAAAVGPPSKKQRDSAVALNAEL